MKKRMYFVVAVACIWGALVNYENYLRESSIERVNKLDERAWGKLTS